MERRRFCKYFCLVSTISAATASGLNFLPINVQSFTALFTDHVLVGIPPLHLIATSVELRVFLLKLQNRFFENTSGRCKIVFVPNLGNNEETSVDLLIGHKNMGMSGQIIHRFAPSQFSLVQTGSLQNTEIEWLNRLNHKFYSMYNSGFSSPLIIDHFLKGNVSRQQALVNVQLAPALPCWANEKKLNSEFASAFYLSCQQSSQKTTQIISSLDKSISAIVKKNFSIVHLDKDQIRNLKIMQKEIFNV